MNGLKPARLPAAASKVGLALAAVALAVAGCSSNEREIASTPNPYAIEGQGVRVGTLHTFGDSYSSRGRWGLPWSEYLQASGRVAAVQNFARGGATAANSPRSFNNQVDQFLAGGAALGPRDLTVAYFGYNDIGRTGSGDALNSAAAGYQQGVNRLINAGAINQERRLLLTQIHDWSRAPGVSPAVAGQVQTWNNFVARVANRDTNLVAVDLFTAINRVTADPGRFGLVNTTDPGGRRANVDFLYFDGIHFGARGATIIARTFDHYLTRGWDWANSLNAGAEASERLGRDIDRGLVFMHLQNRRQTPRERQGLSVMPLADSADNPGLLFHYAPDGERGLRMGVAMVSDQLERQHRAAEQVATRRDLNSDGIASYLALGTERLQATTQLSLMSHSHLGRGQDDLLERRVARETDSRTYSVRQRLQAFLPVGGLTLAPWGAIGHQQQSMATARHETLYTSRSTVRTEGYSLWRAGVGVEAYSPALGLGRYGTLNLTGSLGVREILGNPSVDLTFEEAALPGVRQVETIPLDGGQERRAGLGARLDLTERTALGLGYARLERGRAASERFDLHFSMGF